eukprot:m.59566 g.59566  ORF g.59566 m.59566 type:complete len:57 (+) comp49256_c0_seq7:162-332(+)
MSSCATRRRSCSAFISVVLLPTKSISQGQNSGTAFKSPPKKLDEMVRRVLAESQCD